MHVRLGDCLTTANMRKKQQAHLEWDCAKKEGKTADLLEERKPNVLRKNVAHILLGDDVTEDLRYTELLVPTGGNYQLRLPTVVGSHDNRPQPIHACASWVGQSYLPCRRGAHCGV